MIQLAQIRRALADYRPRQIPRGDMRAAAVLVPLFEDAAPSGSLHLLLTRRTELVRTHRGQVSFPGGKMDTADIDARTCALREAQEEVGLAPTSVEIIGQLDDCPTVVSNFLITPVVGIIAPGTARNASAHEIAELIDLPLEDFLKPGVLQTERTQRGTHFGFLHFYTVRGNLVWGATARILHRLLEVVA